VSSLSVGYARCSTDKQDLRAQKDALERLGIPRDRIYTDEGLSGAKRDRPGLDRALAAAREGDTFVVTKLDRLARSTPDARDIITGLSAKGVRFALGSSFYDWNDPVGKMFLSMLAVIAEFELDLIRQRTREGMAVARAAGKLRGGTPKLSERAQRELVKQYQSGEYTITDLADIYKISRPAVYRTTDRAGARGAGSTVSCNV
jgi:DNA invertase Pin-like site-specific DNA recombinase